MPQDKQLKRQKVVLAKTEDGRYVIIPPEHKGLVLSGGGAKGIAYGGMIRALDESGKLKELTHVSGASAGAMTASLLAIGMPPENIAKLVAQLDPSKLLDRHILGFRAKGDRFRNMLDVIYMVQIKQHLESLQKPLPKESEENFKILSTKIALYEKVLGDQGLSIKNIDDIIKLSQTTIDLERLDKALNGIPQQLKSRSGQTLESPHLTLGDLGLLRELLPDNEKHLIKNLSVCVTNQTKNALERYSEETTPQQPIAQVVQWSGAHPILFVPGRNSKGEHVADGGILDNMPEIDGLDREEVLCVKAETEKSYFERVKKADESTPIMVSGFKRALDYLIQSAFGGTWLNSTAALLNREKVFHHIDNMLYINTGEVTTVNTAPTSAQKKQAIQNGYDQTKELIESQTKMFANPLMTVLYVGFDQLDDALLNEEKDSDLFLAAAHAKKISFLQKQIVDEMNAGQYSSVRNYLAQIEDVLDVDAKLNPEEKVKALALCYKQVNFLSEGKLVNYLNEEAAQKQHWAIRALNFILIPIAVILSPVFALYSLLAEETLPKPVKEIQSEVQDMPVESEQIEKTPIASVAYKQELQKAQTEEDHEQSLSRHMTH